MIALPIGLGVGIVLAIVVVGSLRTGNRTPLLRTFQAIPLLIAVVVAGALLSAAADNDLGPLAIQVGLGGIVAVAVALVGQLVAGAEDAVALRRVEGRPPRTRGPADD